MWIVTQSAVTAETSVDPGRARVDFYRGDVLPGDVPEEDITRLSHFGHIEWVEEPEPVDPDAVPAATIETILGWVGDDPERAQRALDAETAGRGKNRSTLIDRLKSIVEPQA